METRVKTVVVLLFFAVLLPASSAYASQSLLRIGAAVPVTSFSQQADQHVELYESMYRERVLSELSRLYSHPMFIDMYGLDRRETTQSRFTVLESDELGFREGKLFSLFTPEIAANVMARHGLDYLLVHRFRQVDQLANLEVYLVDDSQRYTRVFSQLIVREQAKLILDKTFTAVLKALTGVQYGELSVQEENKGVYTLRIAGHTLTPRDSILQIIPPGSYEVEILHSGRKVDTRSVEIFPGEKTVLEIESNLTSTHEQYLISYPAGGTLLVEGELVGRMPVVHHLDSEFPVAAEAFQSGHSQTTQLALYPESKEYAIQLRPDWMERDIQITTGSNIFYRSLSQAILSLPISIMSKFMYDMNGQKAWKVGVFTGLSITGLLLFQAGESLYDYYHRID